MSYRGHQTFMIKANISLLQLMVLYSRSILSVALSITAVYKPPLRFVVP